MALVYEATFFFLSPFLVPVTFFAFHPIDEVIDLDLLTSQILLRGRELPREITRHGDVASIC